MQDGWGAIEEELNPGEQILWRGQPQQGLVLRKSDLVAIPISIVLAGFAIFWEALAIFSDAPPFFAWWGIPFVLLGLYNLLGRFVTDSARRRTTYYAVTNERVIILSGLFSQTLKTVSPANVPEINLTVRRNGSGTIILGAAPRSPWAGLGNGFAMAGGREAAPSLELIADVKAVYQEVKRLQRGRG